MFRTIWQNLSKVQKIGVVILLQVIFIILIISIASLLLKDRQHIEIEDGTNQTTSIPEEVKDKYREALWEIINQNIAGLDKSVIEDATIREGSLVEEVDEENDTINASFIVDIDSIEQTYVVYVGWSKDQSVITDSVIDCPTPEETKYPNSVCKGTYRDSASPSLYLPHAVNTPDDQEARDILIETGEDENTIVIQIVACRDIEQLKKEAMDYLNSTSINLSEYTIEYDISSLDANCKEEDLPNE